jgi:hypothetical protein
MNPTFPITTTQRPTDICHPSGKALPEWAPLRSGVGLC